MIKIVGVRFRSAGKVYYFDPRDLQLRTGDKVIAETSKGLDYGVISTCTKMVDEELVQQPLRAIVRKTTPEDEEKIEELRLKEKEALKVCREKVHEHELDMKVVGAEYAFDGSKMLFYFTADGRVDFRELVKDLAAVFHMRIELRQIGVRDETRMLGGIGTCGRELCCATYLREFQPVSIKMAKEQNLSLNPAKISGACGRLMCCLKNEEETYEFLNAKMPKMGAEAVTADNRSGKVVELDVLRQRVRVLFEEEDSKELEYFSVEDLTFQPRKKKDPSAQGQEKNKNKKEDKKPEQAAKPVKSAGAEKPKKDAAQDENAPSGENKKKSRKRKHKADAAAAAPEQAADRPAGQDAENSDRTDEKNGSKNGDKAAGKKHRRRRSRRSGETKHTREMKIYADSGTQGD